MATPKLICLYISVIFTTKCGALAQSNSILNVLEPLKNFQIAIRLPQYTNKNDSCAICEKWETPVGISMEHMRKNCIPAQLFRKYKKGNHSSVWFGHARHVHNQFACLAFFFVDSRASKHFRLEQALEGCDGWSQKEILEHRARYEDLVHLIFLHHPTASAARTSYNPSYFFLPRWESPLYLLVFHISHPNILPCRPIQAIDACFGRQSCRMIPLSTYCVLAANRSVYTILKHIWKTKKDYRGDQLMIRHTVDLNVGWSVLKNTYSLPLRKRKWNGVWEMVDSLATQLGTLARVHNFTFVLVRGQGKYQREVFGPDIHMGITWDCLYPPCFYDPAILEYFGTYRTLTSSSLTPVNSFQLQSLAEPMGPMTAGIHLSLALCVSAVIALKLRGWQQVTGALLLAFSSFCSQVSSGNRQLKVFKWFFTLWLLTALFTGVIYTNYLQSLVVVPESGTSELSFDEMVDQNYTFVSVNFAVLKARADQQEQREKIKGRILVDASIRNETWDFIRKERILADVVQEAPDDDDLKILDSLTLTTNTAFVEIDSIRRRIADLVKVLGFNAVEGEDSFHSSMLFTTFGKNQKPLMLKSSVEWMKAMGYFYHFLEKALSSYDTLSGTRNKILERRQRAGQNSTESGAVSLTDSLVAEAFILMMYCFACCLLGIMLELLLQEKCRRKCLAWVRTIARRLDFAKVKRVRPVQCS